MAIDFVLPESRIAEANAEGVWPNRLVIDYFDDDLAAAKNQFWNKDADAFDTRIKFWVDWDAPTAINPDRQRLRALRRADWVEALKLAAVGNIIYYLFLSGGIQAAGVPLARVLKIGRASGRERV